MGDDGCIVGGAAGGSGVGVSLVLRQMARHSLPYASLTVVVTLAAALGVFAGSFQTTLARSEADQASFRVGGDLTLGGASFIGRTEEQRVAALSEIEGINAVAAIIREPVWIHRRAVATGHGVGSGSADDTQGFVVARLVRHCEPAPLNS